MINNVTPHNRSGPGLCTLQHSRRQLGRTSGRPETENCEDRPPGTPVDPPAEVLPGRTGGGQRGERPREGRPHRHAEDAEQDEKGEEQRRADSSQGGDETSEKRGECEGGCCHQGGSVSCRCCAGHTELRSVGW